MKDEDRSIKEELKKEGYSQEELYFYNVNRELIEKRRKRSDSERDKKRSSTDEPNIHVETKGSRSFLKRLKALFKSSEEVPKLF